MIDLELIHLGGRLVGVREVLVAFRPDRIVMTSAASDGIGMQTIATHIPAWASMTPASRLVSGVGAS